MQWSKASIVWNKDSAPAEVGGPSFVSSGVEATVTGGWVHIREDGQERSFPSHLVQRINWEQPGMQPSVAVGD